MDRTRLIASWVLQIAAALAFFGAGFGKLTGNPQMVEVFDTIGVGQWFRLLTGLLEVVGAALLLIPRFAWIGGALLATVMIGAVAAHLFVLGGSPLPPIILFLITGTVYWLRRPQATSAPTVRHAGGAI